MQENARRCRLLQKAHDINWLRNVSQPHNAAYWSPITGTNMHQNMHQQTQRTFLQ
jgi:hypothetical protein